MVFDQNVSVFSWFARLVSIKNFVFKSTKNCNLLLHEKIGDCGFFLKRFITALSRNALAFCGSDAIFSLDARNFVKLVNGHIRLNVLPLTDTF